jgi:hypothetical protein
MTKNIICFNNKPDTITSSHVHMSEINNVPNGSCDTIAFTDINSLPLENYGEIIGALIAKLKITTGILILNTIYFDRVVSDIFYTKIDDVVTNQILYGGVRSVCHEHTISNIVQKSGGKILRVVLDDYNLQLEISRNG